MRRVALAVAVHDPGGYLIPGLERLSTSLLDVFAGVGALVTDGTHNEVAALLDERLGARVAREPAALARAGCHRRRSVELALPFERDGVMYGDLDHVLRWTQSDEAELRRCLELATDFVVVGRTEAGMAESPRRLQDTERIVNHIYTLMTGRDWDLMFGVRLMSGPAAQVIVLGCKEDSLANDVEWPLFSERQGFMLGYFPAAGLFYRTTHDFDAAVDARDHDSALWIARVELAAQHARALNKFVNPADRSSSGRWGRSGS